MPDLEEDGDIEEEQSESNSICDTTEDGEELDGGILGTPKKGVVAGGVSAFATNVLRVGSRGGMVVDSGVCEASALCSSGSMG